MAETSIVYDYEQGEVRVHTDRAGVASRIRNRLRGKLTISENMTGDRITSWNLTIPIKHCRHASMIAKVLSADFISADEISEEA